MNLNNTEFYNSFKFNIFKLNKYHFTDQSKSPVLKHYFGYLIKGTAKIKSKHTEILIYPNEIFYIPKGLKYQSQWYGENGNEIVFYSFGFEFIPTKKLFDLQKISCDNTAKEIFKELCDEVYSSEKRIGKLYYFFEKVAPNMKKAEQSHLNVVVEKAIEYISNNPNVRISELAKHCNVSESGLYSVFKRNLNKTPNTIRNEILCEKAILLLTTTNKSIQEISEELSFSSTSYFRKILKSYIGKTPREIRKNSTF